MERESAVMDGLEDLDTWLSDQVQRGMANFIAQAVQTCRTIAQRLVDAKAPGLAGRLDALPTRLFTLPGPARSTAAIRELGQVYLIGQAYRCSSALPYSLADDARQAVGWTLTREALLDGPELLRIDTTWRVFAVVSEAQPDRLRRVETWLTRQDGADGGPLWAVLIDFVPISTGAAVGGYPVGDQFDAELTFYPSSIPLRAQIGSIRRGAEQRSELLRLPNKSLSASYANYWRALAHLPWLGTFPLSFCRASLRRQGEQLYLYDDENNFALPLHMSQAIQALPLTRIGGFDGIGLWKGYNFTLAWADTRLGRWSRS